MFIFNLQCFEPSGHSSWSTRDLSLTGTPQETPCPSYDLSNQFPWPSRDQDSIGWCFGFIAADLVSAKLGVQVSAADASLHYFRVDRNYQVAVTISENLGINPGTADVLRRVLNNPISDSQLSQVSDSSGGRITETLQWLQRRGACLESDFSSEDFRFSEHMTNLRSFIVTLERAARREAQSYSEEASDINRLQPNLGIRGHRLIYTRFTNELYFFHIIFFFSTSTS